MNPVAKSLGKTWAIVIHSIETRHSTVRGVGAVRGVHRYWTGVSWDKLAECALEFDSEVEVNDYIEQNRTTLESAGQI